MSQKKGDRKILAKKTHIFVEVKEKLRHKPVVGSGEVWGSGWKTMRRQYDKTALSTAPRFDGSWFWDAWPCSFASKEVFGSRYISSTFLWETAELRAWSRASCTRSRRPCGSFIDWQSASFRGCKTTENKKMMTWKPSEFWYEFLYFKFKLRSFSVVFWTKQKGIFKKILSKCSASPYFSQLSQIELSCQSVKQSVHCHSVPWQIAMATCVLVLRDASTQWHTLKNTS